MIGQAIVTDIDRKWALAQKPDWFQMGTLNEEHCELVDDGGWLDAPKVSDSEDERPSWAVFVAAEIERFERHYAGEFKSSADWSSIWRKGWWPRVAPNKRFPKSAPKVPHPYFKRGSPEFDQALRLATPQERLIWDKFGVAQFTPDDKRLKKISSPTLTDRSKAMQGAGE